MRSGSHVILSRVGTLRPVVIPKYDEVGVDIIQANLRTAGLGRKQFFQLLGQV